MNFIVVVDQHYGIGNKDQLLTHIPEDLKYFKQLTLGKVIVMGRATFEALPGKKPLPGRTTIVLTQNQNFAHEEVLVVHNLEELFEILKDYEDEDIFIAGGAAIYEQLLPYCRFGYITFIHDIFTADKFLVAIDQMPEWEKLWESETKTHNGLSFIFTKYQNTQFLPRP